MAKIPVNVITGYLGTGKTTLLRRILETSNQKIAVVMNEFGEVGIDTRVIQGKNVKISELAGGCVCCSMTGEFEAALKEIVETVKPQRIVLETTGIAEPDGIIIGLDGVDGVFLDSVITIVDADGLVQFPEVGHTQHMQIERADIILLNKTDLVDEGLLQRLEERLHSMNEEATIHKTVYCNIDPALLFGGTNPKKFEWHPESEESVPHIEQGSFIWFGGVLDRTKFEAIANSLPRTIERAKGFVVFKDGSFLFNFVNGRWDLEPFKNKKTELVFIGKTEGFAKITKQLKSCEVGQ